MKNLFLLLLLCLALGIFNIHGQEVLHEKGGMSDTSAMRAFTSEGRVGINVAAPSGELHIKGDENISQLQIDGNTTQSNTQPLIRLRNSAGTDLLHIHSDGIENVFIGLSSGRLNNYISGEQGDFNTFIGSKAGFSNTSGSFNTSIGAKALYANATGSLNIAVGANALLSNVSGGNNIAIGMYAMSGNSTGGDNTAVGSNAMAANVEGSKNTAYGTGALVYNVAGIGSTAIGYNAMQFASDTPTPFDSYNVAVGYEALRGSTSPGDNTGNANTALGYKTMRSNTSGFNNLAAGYAALFNNTIGYNNTGSGTYSLLMNYTGYNNTASGAEAMYFNETGCFNTAVGAMALYYGRAGDNATAIGYGAMHYSNNTIIGYTNRNVAVGYQAMRGSESPDLNTGNDNSAFGYEALLNISSGSNNSGFGGSALQLVSTGSNNTALGYSALYSNSSGNYNTAVGRRALYNNSTGSDNTAIGDMAGDGSSGVNFTSCTFIGSTSYLSVNRSNVTMLGAYIFDSQCTGDNQVLLGNTSITQIRAQVSSITTYSDRRIKTNIEDNVPGLDFIAKLKPVTYYVRPEELHRIWGTPDSLLRKIDHTEAEKIRHIGFIAQDVERAAKEIGFDFPGIDVPKSEREVYSMRYVDFIMPLVKAVQEQQEEIEALKAENKILKERMDRLEN